MLLLHHQKFQAVIQNLLFALGQHGQIEFTLDRQQFRDTFEKVMDRVEVDSRTDTLERLIAIWILQ